MSEFPDWVNEETMNRIESFVFKSAFCQLQDEFRMFVQHALRDDVCASPIELSLLSVLKFIRPCGPYRMSTVVVHRQPHQRWEDIVALIRRDNDAGRGRLFSIEIHPQVVIGDYRVDMAAAVMIGDDQIAGLVIECDGHDHHYNTKQKVSADRARDRKLQQLGFKILRFTGSDIHADPIECAGEVVGAAEFMMMDHYHGKSNAARYEPMAGHGTDKGGERSPLGAAPGHPDMIVPSKIAAEFELTRYYTPLGKQLETPPWADAPDKQEASDVPA